MINDKKRVLKMAYDLVIMAESASLSEGEDITKEEKKAIKEGLHSLYDTMGYLPLNAETLNHLAVLHVECLQKQASIIKDFSDYVKNNSKGAKV